MSRVKSVLAELLELKSVDGGDVKMLANFKSMPIILKVIFVFGLIFPLIVFVSIVTGSVLPKNAVTYNYGAANSLIQLFEVFAVSSFASLSSILILLKSKYVVKLFSLLYVTAFLSPLIISAVWRYREYALLHMMAVPIVVVLLNVLMIRSGEIREYFLKDEL